MPLLSARVSIGASDDAVDVFLNHMAVHARAEGTSAFGQKRSFDHPIRAQQHRLRDRDADGSCRFGVDDEIELGRLLDGKVSRFLSCENLSRGARRTTHHVPNVDAVGHQATVFGDLSYTGAAWQAARRNEIADLLPVAVVHWSSRDKYRIRRFSVDCCKRGLNV